MPKLKLVTMVALKHGTIVSDGYNRQGDVQSLTMIHVDPDNDAEKGRYSKPIVTEKAAKALEEAGLAERTGTVDLEDGWFSPIVPIDAEEFAKRVEEFAGAENDHAGVSGLDTRSTTAWVDKERVEGGAGGEDEIGDEDAAPAAPAPAKKPAAKAGDDKS